MSPLFGVRFCDNMDPDYGLPFLPNGFASLVFTSPPYWDFIEYGGKGSGTEPSYEEYVEKVLDVMGVCRAKTHPGARLVLNVSNMKSRAAKEGKAFVYPIVADMTRGCIERGWVFFDEAVWVKGEANAGALGGKPLFGSYPYPPTPKLLDSVFENILVFENPGKKPPRSKETKESSRWTVEDWREMTKGVWHIAPDRGSPHPASFPLELAERVIRLYSFVDDVVLDPYAGVGTTVAAAEMWGRVGIGFEIEPSYRVLYEERME